MVFEDSSALHHIKMQGEEATTNTDMASYVKMQLRFLMKAATLTWRFLRSMSSLLLEEGAAQDFQTWRDVNNWPQSLSAEASSPVQG